MVGMPGSFNSVLTVASLNNPEYFVAIQTQDALLFDDAYPEYGGSWKSRYDDKADYEYKVATRIGGHSYEYSIFIPPSTMRIFPMFPASFCLLIITPN